MTKSQASEAPTDRRSMITRIDNLKLQSRIMDRINNILASKTIEQLDPENHDIVKDEIRERLNEFLGKNAVIAVYFQGFVLQ